MIDDITIPQDIKEDYEYVKCIVEDSGYLMNWSQVLEMLNEHIRQNFPEVPSFTKEYIDHLMYAACFYDNFVLALWLVKNGANVDAQELESGNTLLHLAALNGNVALAKLLIANGAHLSCFEHNIKPNLQGNTYLHLAAERGHDEFIQLIEREVRLKSIGGDNLSDIINYRNKERNTALHLAVKNGHIKCVELMLNLYYWGGKESLISKYSTVVPAFLLILFTALIMNKAIYISYDASIAIGVPMFLTVVGTIYITMTFWDKERNEYLLSTEGNETVLHLAIENIQQENDQDRYYQCTKLLIEETPRSKINTQNKEGNTALHLAAKKGLMKSIESLLNRKADPKIMTNDKKTALHLAIENSHYDCAECLANNIVRVESKRRRWKPKLYKLYDIVSNRYYHIKSRITNLKLRIEKKVGFKENWKKEVLCLAIEHQFKDSSGNILWYPKQEVIYVLLDIVNESDIDEVYDYAKNYAKRRNVKDGERVLRIFYNFFLTHERYKDKNLTKLKKQESWYKDYALYCSNASLTILAVFFLLKQSSNLSKNNSFVYVENIAMVIAKVITILSFFFAVKLYFKHKELDNLKDYQDKIEEINNLSIIKKRRNTSSDIEVQVNDFCIPDGSQHLRETSSQLKLCSNAEGVHITQKQRKSPSSKSELSVFESEKVDSDDQSELIPLLSLSSLTKMPKLLPNELDKLKQTYQSVIGQSPILDIEPVGKLKCKKTLNKALIKNLLFCKRETHL